jgi:uncharacterized protein
MKRLAISISIFFILTSANAASYDCTKANTKVEKIVCSNEEISKLDDLLSELYERTYNSLIQQGVYAFIITDLVKSQRHWLRSIRNACEDANCVKSTYESRINEIGLQIDENDVSTRSLSLKCDFSANSSLPVQEISISGAVYSRGESASIKEFSAVSKLPQHIDLVVKPGQFAECVYPSGFRVRAKVGEGAAYPYGMCGADAEVFLSLWVNKRKIDSRVWFAGHCREGAPVTYRISNRPCNPSILPADSSNDVNHLSSGNTDICVDSDFLNKYPVDLVEYPENGTKTPKVGEYELVAGTDKVCSAVTGEISKGSFSVYGATSANSGEIDRPIWNDSQGDLPQDMLDGGYGKESTYDFDNDGNLDGVFSLSYSTHYMDATVVLVQPGTSPKLLKPVAPLQDKATISVPCQVTGQPSDFSECPPYTQKWDDAGFNFGGKSGESSVYFRSRYSSVEPFIYRGSSYIFVRNGSEAVANYSAVLKPLPQREFEYSCLIRQVVENY